MTCVDPIQSPASFIQVLSRWIGSETGAFIGADPSGDPARLFRETLEIIEPGLGGGQVGRDRRQPGQLLTRRQEQEQSCQPADGACDCGPAGQVQAPGALSSAMQVVRSIRGSSRSPSILWTLPLGQWISKN